MEVYVLDSLLRRDRVIDRFESLIWTERFRDHGDFELVIRSTAEARGLLKPGTMLAMNESFRVMQVETVEDGISSEGKHTLKVQGNSLEAHLKDRVAAGTFDVVNPDGTKKPPWKVTGTAANVMRILFRKICIEGVLDPLDRIPFVVEGSIMPPSNIPEPVDPIELDIKPEPLYEIIKDLGYAWGLGFRLLRRYDTSKLYWDVYSGNDRTSTQTTLPPVLFSQALDNLTDISELNSIEASKNVAYVFCEAGAAIVYPQDVPPDTGGFDRRVLLVEANDITKENTQNIQAALTQIGKSELSKHRAIQAFDGEINQRSQYKYQKDYYLGDIVELQNSDGDSNQMRVTEQIFVSDGNGERSYPTLELNLFINTGSWISWGANQVWYDLDDDPITWSELP